MTVSLRDVVGTPAPAPGGFQFLSAFITAVVFNAAIGIIVMFVFLICRRRSSQEHVYNPRRRVIANPLTALPTGFFNWIGPMLRRDDEATLVQRLGTDAVMYLKFLSMSIQYFLFAFIVAIAAAVLNGYGGNSIQDLTGVALSNVTDGSPLLWADMVFGYLFSLLAYIFFLRCQWVYERLRRAYHDTRPAPHAVLVTVDEATAAQPQAIMQAFPGATSAEAITSTSDLDDAVEKRDEALQDLQSVQAQAAKGKSPTCGSVRGLTKEKLTEKIMTQDATIVSEMAKRHQYTRWSFVEFTSEALAHAGLLTSPWKSRAQLAPAPEDVRWSAMYYSRFKRLALTFGICIGVYLLVLFYLGPIIVVQGLVSLENLETLIPGFGPILNGVPAARGLAEGVIPTIVLTVFLALLPTILRALAKLMGVETRSGVDKQVLSWYFLFQVIAVYIGITMLGGFFGQLQLIHSDPSQIVTVLAVTFPQGATFFLNYIVLQALTGFSLVLLRPAPLILSNISKRSAITPAETELALGTGTPIYYGTVIALNLLVWLVGLCFSTVQPVIVPVCLVYFACAYFAARNNLMFVYVRDYESGGGFWPMTFTRLCFCLFLAQVSLICMVSIKTGFSVIPLAVLPLLTIIFWIVIHFFRRDKHEYGIDKKQAAPLSQAASPATTATTSYYGSYTSGDSYYSSYDATPSTYYGTSYSEQQEDETTSEDSGGTSMSLGRSSLVAGSTGNETYDEFVVAPNTTDRLQRRCYLGALAGPGIRIARKYRQPSLAAATERVVKTANGGLVLQPREPKGLQVEIPDTQKYTSYYSDYYA